MLRFTGDHLCGGEDIDRKILSAVALPQFELQFPAIDLNATENGTILAKIHQSVKQAKEDITQYSVCRYYPCFLECNIRLLIFYI